MLDAFIDENMLIIIFEWAPAGQWQGGARAGATSPHGVEGEGGAAHRSGWDDEGSFWTAGALLSLFALVVGVSWGRCVEGGRLVTSGECSLARARMCIHATLACPAIAALRFIQVASRVSFAAAQAT